MCIGLAIIDGRRGIVLSLPLKATNFVSAKCNNKFWKNMAIPAGMPAACMS